MLQIGQFYIRLIPIANNDKIIDPNNALKNPSTSNPGVRNPASIKSNAFITKLNNPKVRILIGKVIICNKGLMNVFISDIITTTNIAFKKLDTSIPGTTHEVNINASA